MKFSPSTICATLFALLLVSCNDTAVDTNHDLPDERIAIHLADLPDAQIAVHLPHLPNFSLKSSSNPEPKYLSDAFLQKSGIFLEDVFKSDGSVDEAMFELEKFQELVNLADKLAGYDGPMKTAYDVVKSRMNGKEPHLDFVRLDFGTHEVPECEEECLNVYDRAVANSLSDLWGNLLGLCPLATLGAGLSGGWAGALAAASLCGYGFVFHYYQEVSGHGNDLAFCLEECLKNA